MENIQEKYSANNPHLSKKLRLDVFKNDYSSVEFFEISQNYDLPSQTLNNSSSGTILTIYLNDIYDIDETLLSLNRYLQKDHFVLFRFESQQIRRSRLINEIPLNLGKVYYYTFDFLFYRVLARLRLTQKLFLKFSNGKNQVLSVAEVLGRLISCGYDIIEYARADNYTQVLVTVGEIPKINRRNSHGPFIQLKRRGYKGKQIKVLKLRTMRPYAEHLQEYLQDRHGTLDGDKIINDFRVTGWGRTFRRLWIDELPMIYNLLKGDLKVVGVRPLSEAKLKTYPESLRELRIQVKPGLLPPFYADIPKTKMDFYQSEKKYTLEYLKSPLKTDLKYLFLILRNILIKGVRSK